MSQRIHYLVQGRVQGVNFRSFTVSQAKSHGVTGWVKNVDGGHVEGEVQGEPAAIKKFLKDLDEGPGPAKVMKVDTDEIATKEGESSFEQR